MKIKNILSVNNAYYLLVFLMLLPMMIWRDFTPANELRYLSIADEALQNGIMFSFYNHGIMYADKPPLYLWIVMLGKLIFGSHQMWFLSLFSLLPAFIIQVIMDKWTSIELSPGHRFSAKLMLITTGFFLGASIVLRMDMLMCMFITLSLYTFYKMFTGRESKYDKYLFPLYIFLAVFTKGPVGIFIPVLSILAFLTIKGKIKQAPKFLGFRTWIIILLLCLLWFTLTWIEAGTGYLKDLLFNQTYNRAVSSFHHKEPFWYYGKTFLYSFAPWSLFYLLLIFVGIKNKLIKTDIDKFFLTIITTSLLFLSVVSSKIEIYLLPIYPFVAYLSVIILRRSKKTNAIIVVLVLLAVVFFLALPASILFSDNDSLLWLKEINTTLIAGLFILSLAAVISMSFLIFSRNITYSINSIAIGLLITIFIVSFKLPYLNSYIGFEKMCRAGLTLSKEEDKFITYDIRRPENIDVFLGKPIIVADKGTILSDTYKGSVLFISGRALRRDAELKQFVETKRIVFIGDNAVVDL